MSKIVYTGSFQKETEMFSGHDSIIINYVNDLARNIGNLNSNWNDDVSHEFLTSFNNCISDVKSGLDECHGEIGRYFTEIQNVLNAWGHGSSVTLPTLSNVILSDISASATDGSIAIDIDQVLSILEQMKKTIHEIISENNDFSPTAISLSGSSDDILNAVQSNLNAGARSYHIIEGPLSEIVSIIGKVHEKYANKASAISSATAN